MEAWNDGVMDYDKNRRGAEEQRRGGDTAMSNEYRLRAMEIRGNLNVINVTNVCNVLNVISQLSTCSLPLATCRASVCIRFTPLEIPGFYRFVVVSSVIVDASYEPEQSFRYNYSNGVNLSESFYLRNPMPRIVPSKTRDQLLHHSNLSVHHCNRWRALQ